MPTDIPKRPCEEWEPQNQWAIVVDFKDKSFVAEVTNDHTNAHKFADWWNSTRNPQNPNRARVVRVELREVAPTGGEAA